MCWQVLTTLNWVSGTHVWTAICIDNSLVKYSMRVPYTHKHTCQDPWELCPCSHVLITMQCVCTMIVPSGHELPPEM